VNSDQKNELQEIHNDLVQTMAEYHTKLGRLERNTTKKIRALVGRLKAIEKTVDSKMAKAEAEARKSVADTERFKPRVVLVQSLQIGKVLSDLLPGSDAH
jgi:peptidoglycan hydrolase CwlO-like protein